MGCKRLSAQFPVSKNWALASEHEIPFVEMIDSIKLLRKPISYAWSTETLSFSGIPDPLCGNVH